MRPKEWHEGRKAYSAEADVMDSLSVLGEATGTMVTTDTGRCSRAVYRILNRLHAGGMATRVEKPSGNPFGHPMVRWYALTREGAERLREHRIMGRV